jgi:hypothetical protein
MLLGRRLGGVRLGSGEVEEGRCTVDTSSTMSYVS